MSQSEFLVSVVIPSVSVAFAVSFVASMVLTHHRRLVKFVAGRCNGRLKRFDGGGPVALS